MGTGRVTYAISTNTTPFPPCSFKDCDQKGTEPVMTNYGHLGDVCPDHMAELKLLLRQRIETA